MTKHIRNRSSPQAELDITPFGAQVVALAEHGLLRSSYPQLRQICCTFHEGILVLHGEVSSYFLKQMAQSLVSQLEGVGEVLNRIEVRPSERAAGRSGGE